MTPFAEFYLSLTPTELRAPTAAQLDALRGICEAGNSVPHDAAYAKALFAQAATQRGGA